MKKFNKLYMCPMIGGEYIYIVAKSDNHFKKLYNKIPKICYTINEFECIGKFTKVAISWNEKLKKLSKPSGTAIMYSYGVRFNCFNK